MDKDPKFYFEVESSVSNAKQKTRIKSKCDAGRDISESEVEYEVDQGILSKQILRLLFSIVSWDEVIVMEQPEGYVNPEKPDRVYHLKKNLYRLKQSPRQWYLRFDKFMTENNFQRCPFDCCVYHKDVGDISKIYLLLYVDNMLIACKYMDKINDLKQQLRVHLR